MSSTTSSGAAVVRPTTRLEVLFDELAELTGQRNAIDGRIVDIVAEIDHDGLWGATGARTVAGLVAWRTDGSDAHYAELASVASVSQLRKAVSLEPRPEPQPRPQPERSISKHSTDEGACYRIRLPHDDAATFDAALQSHRDALVAEWQRDGGEGAPEQRPPMPGAGAAFMSLVEAGWDADVARRPQGQHTTVVVHLDVESRLAALHLGPLLTDADRQYLTCDATCEVWFERDGRPIGAGRTTRVISRRLRRVLEHRHPTCAVPGCGASRGLHAHHIIHWEDGGPTDLDNLVLLRLSHESLVRNVLFLCRSA